MKVKNFLRICYGIFVGAMTYVNSSMSIMISQAGGLIWGLGVFLFQEALLLTLSYVSYKNILKKHNGEEEL